MKQSKKKFKIY